MSARAPQPAVWGGLAAPPWRFCLGPWPWRSLAYLLISAALAAVLVPLAVVTFLLIPIWGIAVGSLERRRGRIMGFARIPSAHLPVAREERGHWLGIRLNEAATWRGTGALLVDVLVGAAALVLLFFETIAVVVVVGLAVIASGEERELTLFGEPHIGVGPDNWWAPLLLLPPLLAIIAYLNTALAGAQASLLGWVLAPRSAELERRVTQLTRSRATIVAAHEEERRRIERDLHDGAQQDLVGVATALGLLDLELSELAPAADVSQARGALALAQRRTEGALASLRATVRGIHPSVLADRGLVAAIEELAARAPMPVSLDCEEPAGLGPATESAAYFFVAEALTNAARHSGATRASVTVRGAPGALVEVSDDGRGGADPTRGTGLSGLTERVAAVGGSLGISSPAGGPTVLTLHLPEHDARISEEEVERDADPARR